MDRNGRTNRRKHITATATAVATVLRRIMLSSQNACVRLMNPALELAWSGVLNE